MGAQALRRSIDAARKVLGATLENLNSMLKITLLLSVSK
jgi:hypothetical protein